MFLWSRGQLLVCLLSTFQSLLFFVLYKMYRVFLAVLGRKYKRKVRLLNFSGSRNLLDGFLKIRLFVFFIIESQELFFILGTSPLSNIYAVNIFSHLQLVYSIFNSVFWWTEVLNVDESSFLQFVSCTISALCVLKKKYLPICKL